ncbi:TonB-dependent siderophore receptor|uniref:TonB-dependent receptor n=1 Tax=Dendrosporobacter quercicolus TaxID=146817 RepID=UPI00156E37B9|nr:TonB-dependent siderophore receptor [Dendrosporobacter quercicolus]NSL47361.1 TonB-dependent siderophore receptor [Dendrosporobacter quercicolus DSM 1736]
MKKKKSRIRKKVLYALIGSSLFWHAPVVAYAEEAPESASVTGQTAEEQAVSGESAAKRSDFTLEGIEVTARRSRELPPPYAGGQAARGAGLGVLGNKDFMDTPFNVTAYTAQTIEDQQADTLFDVIANDPSVRLATPGGQVSENFRIRGLEINYQHLYFNGIAGLAPFYRVPVEFLERVEVLKGPSSFLYGGVSTSVGGAINLVPKRAGEEDITNFTTSYAAESQFGGHIDIGRRFGENKEWGIRFNGLYSDGDTTTDDQSRKRLLGSLGVDYRKDKWRLSLDAYSAEDKYDGGLISMYSLSSYVKAPDGSTNVFKGASGTTRNTGILFKGEYDIRDNLTAYAGIGKLYAKAYGFINGNHVQKLQTDGSATIKGVYKQYFWNETTASEIGLRGAYQTGAVKHQVVLGANFSDTDYSNAWDETALNMATNIHNPVSIANLYNSLSIKKGNKTAVTELSSFLLADTLSFNEEKVQLTLGIRRQNVDQTSYAYNNNDTTGGLKSKTTYDSHANTPMVGLIVKPWGESVALYANYIEALSPGTVVGAAYANAGQVLAPYKTKQREFGVKWDKGNFANTLAFFQIEVPSSMVTDNVYAYDGEQKNRGIEWNTFGNIAKNLRLLGGIAYTDGELVRSSTVANNGNTPGGVSKWTMNAGVEWDTPWNPDLSLSLRAVYTSSQYANNANTFEIPSWVRYDIGARYKTVINKIPVTYRLSVENLFDKHYWAGANDRGLLNLGSPRTVKLSATMQL